MKVVASGSMGKDGTILLNNEEKFQKECCQFDNCEIVVTITKKKKQRSLKQNAYLHGVIIPTLTVKLNEAGYKFEFMGASAPYTDNYAKIFYKFNFNNGKDTSDSTTVEIETANTKARNWVLETFGWTILLPNETEEQLTAYFNELERESKFR